MSVAKQLLVFLDSVTAGQPGFTPESITFLLTYMGAISRG